MQSSQGEGSEAEWSVASPEGLQGLLPVHMEGCEVLIQSTSGGCMGSTSEWGGYEGGCGHSPDR